MGVHKTGDVTSLCVNIHSEAADTQRHLANGLVAYESPTTGDVAGLCVNINTKSRK